jgi:hypothetical protein
MPVAAVAIAAVATVAAVDNEANKLLNKLSQILLCTIWIDKGLFDCRV